jgi:hypothetical protein
MKKGILTRNSIPILGNHQDCAYPNSIRGLEILLKYLNCVRINIKSNSFTDQKDIMLYYFDGYKNNHITYTYQGVIYDSSFLIFDDGAHSIVDVPLFDLKPIIPKLVKSVLKRIEPIRLEKELFETIA